MRKFRGGPWHYQWQFGDSNNEESLNEKKIIKTTFTIKKTKFWCLNKKSRSSVGELRMLNGQWEHFQYFRKKDWAFFFYLFCLWIRTSLDIPTFFPYEKCCYAIILLAVFPHPQTGLYRGIAWSEYRIKGILTSYSSVTSGQSVNWLCAEQ